MFTRATCYTTLVASASLDSGASSCRWYDYLLDRLNDAIENM